MSLSSLNDPWVEYNTPTVIRQGFVPEDFSELDIPTYLRKPLVSTEIDVPKIDLNDLDIPTFIRQPYQLDAVIGELDEAII